LPKQFGQFQITKQLQKLVNVLEITARGWVNSACYCYCKLLTDLCYFFATPVCVFHQLFPAYRGRLLNTHMLLSNSPYFLGS